MRIAMASAMTWKLGSSPSPSTRQKNSQVSCLIPRFFQATNPVAAYEAAGAIVQKLCSEGSEGSEEIDRLSNHKQ